MLADANGGASSREPLILLERFDVREEGGGDWGLVQLEDRGLEQRGAYGPRA
jgi:hypothetical protein